MGSINGTKSYTNSTMRGKTDLITIAIDKNGKIDTVTSSIVPIETLYLTIAVIIIVVAVLVTVRLRKRSQTAQNNLPPPPPPPS